MLTRSPLPTAAKCRGEPIATIHATAPIRICDIGGWTDTWFARWGKVFNIAVRPLVAVRIDVYPPRSRQARVVLDVQNYAARYAPALDGSAWKPHPLLEAALHEIRPPDDVDIEVTIRSDAPAGASTGTSAAVVVAMLGGLNRLAQGHRTIQEIASTAHVVEAVRLGRQCGIQDQICSAFGGANFIEMTEYPRAVVSQLTLTDRVRRELQRRLALIYLGRPHRSSTVHGKVWENLERAGPDCPQLTALRAAAQAARDALLSGDFDALGSAMRDNTAAQSELHAELVHEDARRVFEIAAAHGAAGWKVNGAGGDGGSMTLLSGADPASKRAMLRAIIEENPALVPLPIRFSREGLRAWWAVGRSRDSQRSTRPAGSGQTRPAARLSRTSPQTTP
ncbi:MAG: GHMP kinase [Acidobacteria bacterium]|nr:GHMP kinase [Acidobacteriota bacterium]